MVKTICHNCLWLNVPPVHFVINVCLCNAVASHANKKVGLSSVFPFFSWWVKNVWRLSCHIWCSGMWSSSSHGSYYSEAIPSASQSRDHEWCLDKLVTESRIKSVHPTTTLSTSALCSPLRDSVHWFDARNPRILYHSLHFEPLSSLALRIMSQQQIRYRVSFIHSWLVHPLPLTPLISYLQTIK